MRTRRISSRLFLILQYLLPKHLVTALIYRLSRIRIRIIKDSLIRVFVRIYAVNVDEALKDVPAEFADFNAFFTRELKAGSRSIDSSANSLASPVDGTVSAIGVIDDKQLVQVKGLAYDLTDLLATDLTDVQTYANGNFATLYLAPYNYHRIHCPFAARLVAARYVPGDLFSVNAATVSLLAGLFARNERLILHFQTAFCPMILIFVGALNVGSISTPWTGQIRPRKRGIVQDLGLKPGTSSETIAKGDLLGWFNMGSTVIVLHPPGHGSWHDDIASGSVLQMGQSIGTLGGP